MRGWLLLGLLLAAILLAPALAQADERDPAALIPADQRESRALFDLVTVIVDKRIARAPTLPPEEPTYRKYYDDAGVDMAYPYDVKLSTADERWFVLRCDSGGSADPQCVFSTSQDPEQEGVAIPGNTFVIPGDGCVYSAGVADRMFDARALYCLKDGALQAVAQPFSYAGFKSKALKPLALHVDKALGGIVTTIAPGGFVEVVLQDGELFLLRDAFGLTGWAKLETGSQQATEIEGFFFHGD